MRKLCQLTIREVPRNERAELFPDAGPELDAAELDVTDRMNYGVGFGLGFTTTTSAPPTFPGAAPTTHYQTSTIPFAPSAWSLGTVHESRLARFPKTACVVHTTPHHTTCDVCLSLGVVYSSLLSVWCVICVGVGCVVLFDRELTNG